MGQQVTIAASQVDKQRLGYCAISLTNFTGTGEPSIVAGSKIEIGGALYEFTVDEAGTGWAGIGASNFVYLLITPSGATCAWSYTTTAPTWDTAKQGYYTGGNRSFAFLWKDVSNLYTLKGMLTPWAQNAIAASANRLGKLWHLLLSNTSSRSLSTAVPPAAASWGGAITGAGVVGIPSVARGIRVRVELQAYATAAGSSQLVVCFSDNDTYTPTQFTAHPIAWEKGYGTGAGIWYDPVSEIDIPLSAAGTFYVYTLTASNITLANSGVYVSAVGFYMGD